MRYITTVVVYRYSHNTERTALLLCDQNRICRIGEAGERARKRKIFKTCHHARVVWWGQWMNGQETPVTSTRIALFGWRQSVDSVLTELCIFFVRARDDADQRIVVMSNRNSNEWCSRWWFMLRFQKKTNSKQIIDDDNRLVRDNLWSLWATMNFYEFIISWLIQLFIICKNQIGERGSWSLNKCAK